MVKTAIANLRDVLGRMASTQALVDLQGHVQEANELLDVIDELADGDGLRPESPSIDDDPRYQSALRGAALVADGMREFLATSAELKATVGELHEVVATLRQSAPQPITPATEPGAVS